MSGGIAYVLDPEGVFNSRCNTGLVELEGLDEREDIETVRMLLERHREYTGSTLAARLLEAWDATRAQIVKVIPRDYKRVLGAEAKARAEQREPRFAELVGAVNG
jgi:glutamate synthase domain-containing protein 3